MEKNNNIKDSRKPWVKDLRNEGNKTLFGRSGIQIRGLRPSKSNITSESRPKRKKKYNHILDSSDNSEDNSPAHDTINGKTCRNSSSASTDCDDNSHFSVTTNKKHKQSKKKQSPPLKRISSSSSETDEYKWQVIKKHVRKKSGTSNKEASGIIIISCETDESSSTNISVSSNKQKRQLSDSGEASSGPSTAKNFKYILEESTEENSDSHWMSIKNLKKRGSDHGFTDFSRLFQNIF
jgi:hypothetical protein